jgi:hypothetical protein
MEGEKRRDISQAYEIRGMYTKYLSRNLEVRYHLGDIGLDGSY